MSVHTHTLTGKQHWHLPLKVLMPRPHPEEQNSEDKPHPEADPKAVQPDPDDKQDQVDNESPYVPQPRAGHPLVCHLPGSECTSAVRMLRAAVVHHPQLT